MKAFVIREIVARVDTRAVNRLLANPCRFPMRNSMVWSSFLTALEAIHTDTADLPRPANGNGDLCRSETGETTHPVSAHKHQG
jgi:hypothetical protein